MLVLFFLCIATFMGSTSPMNSVQVFNYPVVLMHGVLADKDNLDGLKVMLELNFNIKVYNLEIGNGVETSIYTSMDKQLDMLCKLIYSMDELKNGFNFIGMSQGGLLARGYVEYCNNYRVHNLITLVSPNAGIFSKNSMASSFYEPSDQSELSITNYWRDPYRYNIYLTNSTYLAQLNNDVSLKENQNNLDVIENFVMVWSANDEVIEPPESSKFSIYEVNNNELILIELRQSKQYNNDFLKLRTMDNEDRLHIYETDCLHAEHREPGCFQNLKHIFEKFLL